MTFEKKISKPLRSKACYCTTSAVKNICFFSDACEDAPATDIIASLNDHSGTISERNPSMLKKLVIALVAVRSVKNVTERFYWP